MSTGSQLASTYYVKWRNSWHHVVSTCREIIIKAVSVKLNNYGANQERSLSYTGCLVAEMIYNCMYKHRIPFRHCYIRENDTHIRRNIGCSCKLQLDMFESIRFKFQVLCSRWKSYYKQHYPCLAATCHSLRLCKVYIHIWPIIYTLYIWDISHNGCYGNDAMVWRCDNF